MNEQVEWKHYRGTYLGLAEAQKTGYKKDGTVWTRSKMNFSHAEGMQCKFATFQDISGLQMNQQYYLLFKEDEVPLPDGTTGKTKTATKIEPHTDQTKPLGFEQSATPQQIITQGPTVTTPTAVMGPITTTPLPSMQKRTPDINPAEFLGFYKKSVPVEEQSLNDFVGRFTKNTNPEQYKLLEELFNSGLEAPKPQFNV